jgi:hypothetical protein
MWKLYDLMLQISRLYILFKYGEINQRVVKYSPGNLIRLIRPRSSPLKLSLRNRRLKSRLRIEIFTDELRQIRGVEFISVRDNIFFLSS